jgi:hypothetical protein
VLCSVGKRLDFERSIFFGYIVNPLNAKLNPIRHLLALVGARHIVHVSRIRAKPNNHDCIYMNI